MSQSAPAPSRRALLKGAALVGAGSVAFAACSSSDKYDGRGVYSRRVERVGFDPSHDSWGGSPYTDIELGPQNMALPQQLNPQVAKVRVRSAHDGERIAFRLDWDDPNESDMTIRVDDFRDACAVLLAPGDADEGMRMMGTAEVPVTLLHWKADWERMVAKGDEGLDVAFPNRSVDTYPIIWQTPAAEVGIDTYVEAGATEWLPAVHVKNPVAGRATRFTSVEKAIAYSFSTTATAPTQDARGRGRHSGDGWSVVLVKPLGARDPGEIDLKPGTISTCAFAVWSGARRDVGSRKCPATRVAALELEA